MHPEGSGFECPTVARGVLLLGLEMKRVVKMLPGQRVGLRKSKEITNVYEVNQFVEIFSLI